MYITKDDILFYHPDFAADDTTDALILKAEQNIDNLTYRRITQRGFDKLSEFQQERVKAACCQQVVFLSVYGDVISSPFKSYGINGVSMTLDEANIVRQNGVVVSTEVYSLLQPTGLLYRDF